MLLLRSTIITFGVIGISLFSGAYDDITDSSELSRIISENSFVLMNLVYQLTKLVNISGTAAGMAGATHRELRRTSMINDHLSYQISQP